MAAEGSGVVLLKDQKYIQGNGTKFKAEVSVGDVIAIRETSYKLKVEEVVSDIKLIISPPKDNGVNLNSFTTAKKFKIVPHLDHSKFYSSVFLQLISGLGLNIQAP